MRAAVNIGDPVHCHTNTADNWAVVDKTTNRAGKRAIQFAGSAAKGLLVWGRCLFREHFGEFLEAIQAFFDVGHAGRVADAYVFVRAEGNAGHGRDFFPLQ